MDFIVSFIQIGPTIFIGFDNIFYVGCRYWVIMCLCSCEHGTDTQLKEQKRRNRKKKCRAQLVCIDQMIWHILQSNLAQHHHIIHSSHSAALIKKQKKQIETVKNNIFAMHVTFQDFTFNLHFIAMWWNSVR